MDILWVSSGSPSEFLINLLYSILSASPDRDVHDPLIVDEPFEFVEIKCLYAVKRLALTEDAHTPGFFCIQNDSGELELKKNHSYYVQIQGQMAAGKRPWCDFVIYTLKG